MQIIEEKKLDNAVIELLIEVPESRIEIEYKSVFDKIARSASIDGFRKGKAPARLVESLYKDRADMEVLENILKYTYIDALQEKKFAPIGDPSFDFTEFERGKPFKYTVKFEVMPTIELGQYKEIEAKERVCEVTEKDIDREIERLREKNARISQKDEGAVVEKGDLLRFQIKRIDNVSKEEAGAVPLKEYSIVVGKSREDHTVDKHVVGMKKGESREFDIKYPKDYEVKDLAGQKVKYHLVAGEISKMEVPAADDEFARDVSSFETITDLRKNIKESMQKYANDMARGEVTEALLKQIISGSSFDIAESMIQKEMDSLSRKLFQRAGVQVQGIDEFAAMMGVNADELKGKIREEAVNDIKSLMIRMEVAKKENISFAPEEYDEMVRELALQGGKTVEDIQKLIDENQTRENIETELVLINARKFIYENAKIKKSKPVSFEDFFKKEQ